MIPILRLFLFRKSYALTFLILFGLYSSTQAQYSRAEKKIGWETYKTVRDNKGFYKNRLLQAWVEQIGRSLELKIEEHYNFKYFLVDDPEPNAFATVGGYIYVNRGLLVYTNTPDELAGILSHELIHVTREHVKKRVTSQIIPQLLQLPANIIGLLTYKEVGDAINAPIKAASNLVTNAYSRTQENEADLYGIQLAIKAGYNPYGLMDILQRIDSNPDSDKFQTLFKDHPLTENRVADMTKILTANEVARPKKIPGTFISFLDGLHMGQNPANGITNGTAFIHPALDLYYELPTGWVVQNTPISLSAVSPNKKSTLVISIDGTNRSAFQAAVSAFRDFKKSDIIDRGPVNYNGLNGYKITVKDRRIKYADLISEVLWIKIPSTNTVMKIVGISHFNDPNPAILESFDTFRQLTPYDKTDAQYPIVKLRKTQEDETLTEYANRNGLSWQLKLLTNMNDLGVNDTVPKIKFMKTITLKAVE